MEIFENIEIRKLKYKLYYPKCKISNSLFKSYMIS